MNASNVAPAAIPGASGWREDQGRCPGNDAIATIANKWKASIVALLSDAGGTLRFAALQRALAPASRKVLSTALRELEADGIIERRAYAEARPRVDYSLTAHGHRLIPILKELRDWAVSSVDVKDGFTG